MKTSVPSIAPTTAKGTTQISLEKLTYFCFAYIIKLIIVKGKMTATAFACACFWSQPLFRNIGTASMPPPAPKRMFTAPTNMPKSVKMYFFIRITIVYGLKNGS